VYKFKILDFKKRHVDQTLDGLNYKKSCVQSLSNSSSSTFGVMVNFSFDKV
jgi:hypothetical protein